MTNAVYTVPAGTVGSDLTNFVNYVDLSDMPAAFWSGVSDDGGDIRVKTTGGADLPTDLVWIDKGTQTGALFFRQTLTAASDTVVHIHYDTGLSRLAVDAANGRNAVWQDYEAVYHLGDDPFDRTGNAGSLRIVGEPYLLNEIATSGDINGHEGVATDGTYYYVFDSYAIRKYSLIWDLVTEITDIAASYNGGLGDGCVYNGVIYVAADNGGTQYLAKYNAADLTFIEQFNIESIASGAAGFCYNANDNLLYTIQWPYAESILKLAPTDGSLQGTITLSQPLVEAQGITIWRNAFWVPVDNVDETYRVSMAGIVTDSGLFGPVTTGVAWEGIDVAPGGKGLIVLDDNGTIQTVREFQLFGKSLSAGGGSYISSVNGRIIADLTSTGSLGTEWTVGASFQPTDDSQRVILSLATTGVGFVGTNVNVSVDDGNSVGIYDSDNFWHYCNPTVDPPTTSMSRVNVSYNGTISRSVYFNGGNKGVDNTISARGSGVSHIVLGSSLEGDYGEPWLGYHGFFYARTGVLSDDWIAAEYENLNSPATFYTLADSPITATIAVTEPVDAFAADGGPVIEAEMAVTEPSDTPSAEGGPVVGASIDITESADTFSAEGVTAIDAAMVVTESDDMFSAEAEPVVEADFAVTESSDTFAAEAQTTIPNPFIEGNTLIFKPQGREYEWRIEARTYL